MIPCLERPLLPACKCCDHAQSRPMFTQRENNEIDAGSPAGSVSLAIVPTHFGGVGMSPCCCCSVCVRCNSELDAATEMLTVAFTLAVSLRSFRSSKTRTTPCRSHVACETKFTGGAATPCNRFRSVASPASFAWLKEPGLAAVTESGSQRE